MLILHVSQQNKIINIIDIFHIFIPKFDQFFECILYVCATVTVTSLYKKNNLDSSSSEHNIDRF